MTHYKAVIGLEVHCQLKTKSKIFSPDPYAYGAPANTQAGPVTLGLPGVLPVLNAEVLRLAVLAGLALDCKIAGITKFDRKHYFYPDLPKGYQISQYDQPYATNGILHYRLRDDTADRQARIHRIHMEEDAGKLLHAQVSGLNASYVDLNRAGAPLIEIVSEPDLRTGEEAFHYLQVLRNILRNVGVSDCNMEEGSLRCDANVSIRPSEDHPFGIRAEIKNLNSFRAVRAAIEYEIKHQARTLDAGGTVVQCTKLWDADKRETRLMRIKEDAEDYRYFPEPDLSVFHISPDYVKGIQESMPELPAAKKARYIRDYGLPEYDADVLTKEKEVAEYYERVVSISGDAKKSSNWVKDEVLGVLNKHDWSLQNFHCTADRLGRLVALLNEGKITGKMGKQIFEHIYTEDLDPEKVIDKYNYKPTELSNLPEIIEKVLAENDESVQKVLSGKDRVKGFLVGQIMKATRGQAPPAEVNRLLDDALRQRKV